MRLNLRWSNLGLQIVIIFHQWTELIPQLRFCPQHMIVSRLVPYLLRFAWKSSFTLDLLLAMHIHRGQQAPNLTEIGWALMKSNCRKITLCLKWYPWHWECTFSKSSALCQECTMMWIMKMNNAKWNAIHHLHISNSFLPQNAWVWKLQTRLFKIQTNTSIKLE